MSAQAHDTPIAIEYVNRPLHLYTVEQEQQIIASAKARIASLEAENASAKARNQTLVNSNHELRVALKDAARWLESVADVCELQSVKDAAARANQAFLKPSQS